MRFGSSDILLAKIREGREMSFKEQLKLTYLLSVPAMLAQLSTIIMQYIDASMVGTLGADGAASIGLVSSSLWLFGGICGAATTGFAVQVAHRIGANDHAQARNVLRQSLGACLIFSVILMLIGISICKDLPVWLRGNEQITGTSSRYFFIFMLGIPFLTMELLAGGMLRCSGNMKIPSILNVVMCVLDVIFNFIFIFPTHHFSIAGLELTLPGFDLGVTGAAIGTILAEVVVCLMMVYYLLFRSKDLNLLQDRGSFRPTKECLVESVRIGFPMGLQHIIICTGYIAITAIVAPLGSIAIAANTFAIIAESLCYMPGYGIGDAATTLVGQGIGAKRILLTKSLAYITVGLGIVVMSVMGVLLYVGAPMMMGLMTPVREVSSLAADVLRIEAFAEPLYAAAIVSYGVFVGAGDTMTPCWMNVFSMWGVRLTLAAILVTSMGLVGIWVAMCVELCFRGTIFLIRLASGKWMKHKPQEESSMT